MDTDMDTKMMAYVVVACRRVSQFVFDEALLLQDFLEILAGGVGGCRRVSYRCGQ